MGGLQLRVYILRCVYYPLCHTFNHVPQKLKKFAEKKLDVIGVDFERDVFVGLGIGGILGKLGSEVKPQRPRQDQYLPMPSKFEPVYDFEEIDEEDLDAAGKEEQKKEQMDEFYIALLLTAVHAVDPLFQEE